MNLELKLKYDELQLNLISKTFLVWFLLIVFSNNFCSNNKEKWGDQYLNWDYFFPIKIASTTNLFI